MTHRSFTVTIKETAAQALRRGARALTSPSATVACAHFIRRAKRLVRQDGPSDIDEIQDILVLRPDGIGDVIMTGPFLRELRHTYPDARITLVVAPRALNVVETCPYVDGVLTVQIPPPISVVETWWRPLTRRAEALSLARRHLWRNRYDLALVPRWGVDHHEASVLAYLSRAPIRIGYSERVSPERERKNRGYDRFFTQVVDDRTVKHEVQRNVGLLSALGIDASEHGLEAWLSVQDEEFVNDVAATRGKAPLVAVGPGAGHPKRVWPIERFAETGRWLTDRGVRLIVIGGPGEEALGRELRRRLGDLVLDLTSRTTPRESIAVLRNCSLFFGNDGGPMHLAAAAGIPVVEVSCHPERGDDLHPNSPTRFGPWGVPHRVVRPKEPADGCVAGCRVHVPHCILNVQVRSVIAAVESLMEETATLAEPTMSRDSLEGRSTIE
jgi:ADP-heptose:LPS heptosyltransferase